MVKSAINQAKLLLPYCFNQQGIIDADNIKQVVSGLMASDVSHKPAILRQLKRLINQEVAKQQAIVTSAHKLDDTVKDKISTYIKKHNPGIRTIDWHEDANLLGGFTIRMNDMWHDLSTTNDLQTIREQLSQ